MPEKEWSGLDNFKKSLTSAAIDADSAPGHSGKGKGGGKKRAKAKAKVRVKEKGEESEISLASPLAPTDKRASATCMFGTDNVPMTTARAPIYPKIKSSVHLGKAARISGIRPARATMRTRVHADAVKGKEHGKERKARGMIVPHQEEQIRIGHRFLPNWSFSKSNQDLVGVR